MTAADRWAQELEGWRIPDEIMARAPESPWGFPPQLFGVERATGGVLHRIAGRALGQGGTVLDVGCGGGVASVPLVPPATHLTGVDGSPAMLEAYARAAGGAHVRHTEILGDWPDVAGHTPEADVVVCRNVVYNVPDIAPFVTALSDHAARQVVVELTESHPSVALAPLWMRFWNLERPDGPTADLFGEIVAELGIEPTVERETRPSIRAGIDPEEHVAFIRRRLCLDGSRDAEIAAALDRDPHVDETTVYVFAWSP
jgi:SAM-dependent methyltransferase